MKKPSWFRLYDLITLGFTGFLALSMFIYALVVGVQGPHATQAMCLLATVAVVTFGITAVFMYQRKQWLDTFVWYPTYGFMVSPENWLAVTPEVFDAYVKQAVTDWSVFFSNAGAVLTSDVNWVYFKKDLNETALNPANAKVKGLTIAGTHSMDVDYDTPQDDLKVTALRHEIGHVIYGNITNAWDVTVHHKFMGEHGLL